MSYEVFDTWYSAGLLLSRLPRLADLKEEGGLIS
jgi:hypothetical protein